MSRLYLPIAMSLETIPLKLTRDGGIAVGSLSHPLRLAERASGVFTPKAFLFRRFHLRVLKITGRLKDGVT